jgi:hypothetical protein
LAGHEAETNGQQGAATEMAKAQMNRAHDFLLIVKRKNGDVAISATRRNEVVRCRKPATTG